ncbi:glutathione S-transferase [Exidia glandulosa HHB12029]|uniref:Glutathione S-transferase n=1 Tax=Exidia glandulosa HHB12029 TaxID=1314781 RepID=A0A165BNA1_EXIGL|nr:glutathione S-transferase [Exidia glandulosa HHB12029]
MSSASTKPILLYTWSTPNGYKPSILLEELKAVYPGFDYDWKSIDVWTTNEQKEPWFLAINPNGRIPALVDRSRGGFHVFESAAILYYLERHYDKDHKFAVDADKDPDAWSEIEQWVAFVHGGINVIQAQANYFRHSATDKIEYAINRYLNETKRLYSVLNTRLEGREYLAGSGKGKYTIADINAFPLVNVAPYSGINSYDEWPNLKVWLERIRARPAVQAGLSVPQALSF